MKNCLSLLTVLLLSSPALAEQPLQGTDEFRKLDQKFLAPMKAAGLGFVVKIFTNDRVIYQASYGMANLPKQVANSEITNFNLASNTKQFTAALALLLESEGRLNPKDPVSKFIPEFGPQYSKITVEQLIHHTSGLPEYWELCDGAKNVKNKDILDLLNKKNLEFEPGNRFSYSNSGYVVLSEIIERVSGKSFPDFLKQRILNPLGMSETIVHDEDSENNIPHQAIGYAGAPDFEEDDASVCNYNYGDSSLYSSLNDYSKWLLALSSDGLFSPMQRSKIFAKSATTAGKAVGYGYGWGVYQFQDGTPIYDHAGSWLGFRSVAAFLPAHGIWFMALSNSAGFAEDAVADSYLNAALAMVGKKKSE